MGGEGGYALFATAGEESTSVCVCLYVANVDASIDASADTETPPPTHTATHKGV